MKINKHFTNIAFIFARKDSKGLKNKNIKNLHGKPLIAWTIETAKKSKLIDKVFVSTDCELIADISKQYGADVPFIRPKSLAKDNTPELMAWQHAINFIINKMNMTFDNFISLPCTSPLRHVEDIDNAIKAFCKQNPDLLISVTESNRNPYFNMVSKDEHGFCKRVIEPDEIVHNRQHARKVWDITTVIYISNQEYIMSSHDILSGKVYAFDIPRERSLDIDTELDFKHAEYLITNAKG